MKLGHAIKALRQQIQKEESDKEIETCLSIIVDKFCMDEFNDNSIELDIYWKNAFGEYNDRPWDDSDKDDTTRLFYYNQAYQKLVVLAKKLNKHGFKCKAMRHGKNGTFRRDDGTLDFHNPWISVKV